MKLSNAGIVMIDLCNDIVFKICNRTLNASENEAKLLHVAQSTQTKTYYTVYGEKPPARSLRIKARQPQATSQKTF